MTRDEVRAHDRLAILTFLHKLNTPEQVKHVSLAAGGWMNPSNVCSEFGYEDADDFDSNGWEYDYWVTMKKEGYPDLQLAGSGYSGSSFIMLKETSENGSYFE